MRAIVSLLTLCFGIVNIMSQTSYYATTKTFYESGYTYQCDVPTSGMVSLYNTDNQLTYTDVVYKATGEFYSPKQGEYIDTFEDDTWTKQLCHYIVDNAFSKDERLRVKGREFAITMYIDLGTGKVAEVDFRFVTFGPYVTIPISVYRQIETELKSKVWFIPTEEGRKLNYILLSWRQEPIATNGNHGI